MLDRVRLKQDIFRMSRPKIIFSTLKYYAVLEWAACDCSYIKFFLFFSVSLTILKICEIGQRFVLRPLRLKMGMLRLRANEEILHVCMYVC